MKLIKSLFTLGALILSSTSFARVDVLFHPKGPTLESVAAWIESASSRVDIAMYNMETTSKSPIIKMLQSPSVSKRLANGDLKIRLIFEGYGTPAENEKNMQNLENLGIDVRSLNSGKKVHHKFAVIDPELPSARVITGSANWSLNSRNNYHENILFVSEGPSFSNLFESEFEMLWKNSKEFGVDLGIEATKLFLAPKNPSMNAHFNSINYSFLADELRAKPTTGSTLTNVIVKAIHSAQKSILVATTRIKIKEVADALKAARQRGVDVKIVVSMDEYRCSPGRSYSRELSKDMEVRVKIYNLNPCEYLVNQMHNKYMIVDGHKLLSGSFNWSNSSELSHIENIVEISANKYPDVVAKYVENFWSIWNLNRSAWNEEKVATSTECAFTPTALSFKEIDSLYRKTEAGHCRQ